jgi:hypothetical protein
MLGEISGKDRNTKIRQVRFVKLLILLLLIPTSLAYETDYSHDIYHPKNASSFITPDNPTVNLIAKGLFLDTDGYLRYKNLKVIACHDCWSRDWWDYPFFVNNYVYDENVYNEDRWLMPEQYIKNGFKGDCEDWAVTIVSIMLSGNITVNGKPQVIPARVVLGYVGDIRDAWVEYKVNNQSYITSTSYSYSHQTSLTLYQPKDNQFKTLIYI